MCVCMCDMKGEMTSSAGGGSYGRFASSHTSPPHHRKSTNTDHPSRKPRPAPDAALLRGLWPSSSSSGPSKCAAGASTLADHLGDDRMIDLLDRLNCSGRLSYEGAEENLKENRRLGGSMRYTTRHLHSPRSPLSSSSSMAGAAAPAASVQRINTSSPRRLSIHETALHRHNTSDSKVDIPSWESNRCESTATPRRSFGSGSSPRLPSATTTQKRRTSSWGGYGSTPTQWALSPGRFALPSEVCKKQQAEPSSGPMPSSPGKVKGKGGKVGGLASLGLHLFRRKPSASSPAAPLEAGGEAARDAAHKLRMCSNHLLQWRYVNAMEEKTNWSKSIRAEEMLLAAWGRIRKVQSSVVKKRVQLENWKLEVRLSGVLRSQMWFLEDWRDMEKQHSMALSATANYLHAAACKVPLTQGAKAEEEATSAVLRRAMDLMTTMKAVISFFSPMAQTAAPLISELADVVVMERSLLEECSELMALFSTLQMQEWSLKCHIMQLKSLQRRHDRMSQSSVDAGKSISLMRESHVKLTPNLSTKAEETYVTSLSV